MGQVTTYSQETIPQMEEKINMEIKVLVEAPALVAVLERFASILEKGQGLTVLDGTKEKNKREPYERHAKMKEDPKQEVEEEISVVDLRAKAQEVGKTTEAKKAIKALLNDFECKSISDIPTDKRADFMKELEKI